MCKQALKIFNVRTFEWCKFRYTMYRHTYNMLVYISPKIRMKAITKIIIVLVSLLYLVKRGVGKKLSLKILIFVDSDLPNSPSSLKML